MALAGHDTAHLVFNDPATGSSYSGTLSGVVAGELIVACVTACADSGGTTPSGWTVTLGGDTLTFRAGDAPGIVAGVSAIFTGVASSSGDQTLSVSTGGNLRACSAHAFRITGFDSVTPIPNVGSNNSHGSNASALTSPSGVTTAANGNAIIGCIGINGGDTTALAVGAADGSTTGQSGSNASNDHEWGVAWDRTPTAASVTFAWTWSTNPARPAAAWIEVAEAAASGTNVSAAKATLQISPRQASVANDVNVSTASASLRITTNAASIANDVNVTAGAANLRIAPNAASISVDTGVSAAPAALQITGHPASIGKDTNVAAGAAALQVTTHAADISTALQLNVDAAPAALRITTYPAAIGRDVNVLAAPAALQFRLRSATVQSGAARVARGDDAFRSSGSREEFWRRKAEEWLEEHLQRVQSAAGEGRSARKRAARRIVEAAERALVEMPQIAPRIDMIAAFARQLAEERPDFTALAAAVAAQMAQVEAEKRARRRKRDLEAVLLLAA